MVSNTVQTRLDDDIRMEVALEKRWSVTVSDLQAWTYILDCKQRYAGEILFVGATCGVSVWNSGLTESTASVYYLHRVLD